MPEVKRFKVLLKDGRAEYIQADSHKPTRMGREGFFLSGSEVASFQLGEIVGIVEQDSSEMPSAG